MKTILRFTFILFIGIISFLPTVCAQSNYKQVDTTESSDTLVAIGKLIRKPMITKNNIQSTNVNDYYFKTGDKEYFIKYKEGLFTKDSLDKYIDKNVKISYMIKNGSWDSVGIDLVNPTQSRIGQYIVFIMLKEE